MIHSFLCIVGHHVYPRFGYMTFGLTFGADFDRFVRQPSADAYNALTFTASTS